jgi:SP family general alpha glucoside:H+ symporter-like MFS transporter
MWGVGQLLATGVLRALLSRTDEWSFRIPMALQWAFAVPLLISISFAPESPWFFVRRGRIEDARKSLQRLSQRSEEDIQLAISMMQHTDEVEKEISAGTTYADCFRGVNLRRTEITSLVWVIQAASGASLMGFSAYFFQQAGLPTTTAFNFSLGLYSIAIVSVVIAWFVIARVGRRRIYVLSLCGMALTLLTIGFLSIPSLSPGTAYATGSLLLIFTLIYDIGVGTIAYSIVTEMPSSRLRTKTIVIGRSLYNVQGCINSVLTPYMLNPTVWDWKGKAGFFWGGMATVCLTWAFFRLPEPKDRSFAEMDLLFERKISARKFRSTELDPFEVTQHAQTLGYVEAGKTEKV